MQELVGERILMRIHLVHTDRIEVMSHDMPLLIECVDTEEKIRSILPELDALLGGGLITLERAEVIVYRAGGAAGESDAGRDA